MALKGPTMNGFESMQIGAMAMRREENGRGLHELQ